MEEGRLQPKPKKEKPTLTIYYSMANFIKNLKIGDEGNMALIGTISSERKNEDSGKIYKKIKIGKLSPISGRIS